MLTQILTQLQNTLPASRWTAIEIAEDVDKVGDLIGQIDSGSVIVVPYRERAEANSLATGGFRQRITVQFITVIVLREYDHRMGGTRAARFDAAKRDVEAALAGWRPADAIQPCELVDGESSPFDRGVSFYLHTWQTARFLTGAPS